MKNLEEATEEEIRLELERRKKAQAPTPITTPDFSRVIDMTLRETQHLIKEGCSSKDFEYYLYKEVMKAVYGPTYWKWRNSIDGD